MCHWSSIYNINAYLFQQCLHLHPVLFRHYMKNGLAIRLIYTLMKTLHLQPSLAYIFNVKPYAPLKTNPDAAILSLQPGIHLDIFHQPQYSQYLLLHELLQAKQGIWISPRTRLQNLGSRAGEWPAAGLAHICQNTMLMPAIKLWLNGMLNIL